MWLETIVLLVPLVLGGIQALSKHDAVDEMTENFMAWLESKNRNVSSDDSILAKSGRFSVELFSTLFRTIHDLTAGVGDYGLRSGIRLAAYLYLFAFLFILLITFGYKVIILVVIVLGLLLVLAMLMRGLEARKSKRPEGPDRDFIEKIWPYFKTDSARSGVAGLFNVGSIEVDYTGEILALGTEQTPGGKRIGRVDKNGHIYDTREQAAERIGRINDQGQVVSDRPTRPRYP
jgi:hypothetical protein